MASLWPTIAQGVWWGSHFTVWVMKYFIWPHSLGLGFSLGLRLEFVPLRLYRDVFVALLLGSFAASVLWLTNLFHIGRFLILMALPLGSWNCLHWSNLVIPFWTHILVFGFCMFFPTPKNCFVENATHNSNVIPLWGCSHRLQMACFLMLTLSVDVYIQGESAYAAKSYLSEN